MSDKFTFLLQIIELYRKQADKCEKSRAYLAGCILLGAALEAGLLAMAMCYGSQIRKTNVHRQLKSKPLEKYGLFELLRAARELKWIQSSLPMDKIARSSGVRPEEALKKGDLAYFADVVREMRDMVHPGRYLRLWKGVKITKRYFEFSYEVIELVFRSLYSKLVDDLGQMLSSQKTVP